MLSREDPHTHKPSMFQSYIKVIFSDLKLSYFILNLCIAEQLFTGIFHQFTDQAITNKTCLDGELATAVMAGNGTF